MDSNTRDERKTLKDNDSGTDNDVSENCEIDRFPSDTDSNAGEMDSNALDTNSNDGEMDNNEPRNSFNRDVNACNQ